jgi:DNA invertase Pin-like site-specific DNA recombinase
VFPEVTIPPGEPGEPKVVTSDVRAILKQAIRPGEDDDGGVAKIAEKAHTSTRTVYRVLSPKHAEAISLDLADRLCIAAGSHVALCRLKWPDGRITSYF